MVKYNFYSSFCSPHPLVPFIFSLFLIPSTFGIILVLAIGRDSAVSTAETDKKITRIKWNKDEEYRHKRIQRTGKKNRNGGYKIIEQVTWKWNLHFSQRNERKKYEKNLSDWIKHLRMAIKLDTNLWSKEENQCIPCIPFASKYFKLSHFFLFSI